MKKVGLLELDEHEHILESMCEIIPIDDTHLTVFTTVEMAERIPERLKTDRNIDWISKGSSTSKRSYLRTIEQICREEVDVLLVTSLYGGPIDFFQYSRLDPNCRQVLFIHNCKSWLNPPVWNGDLAATTITLFRRIILPRFDAINVVYPPIKDYVESSTDWKKPVYDLLPTHYAPTSERPLESNGKTVQFVVPGTIARQRRDYTLLLNAFERLFDEHGDALRLHLLGRPEGEYGHSVIEKCSRLQEAGYDVRYETEWVTMEYFDSILREADVVVSPIRFETSNGEQYGRTKASGNVTDAIKHGKSLVVPAHFPIASSIQSSTIQYESSESLFETLSDLISTSSELRQLKAEARQTSLRFTIKRQRDRVNEIMKELGNEA